MLACIISLLISLTTVSTITHKRIPYIYVPYKSSIPTRPLVYHSDSCRMKCVLVSLLVPTVLFTLLKTLKSVLLGANATLTT